MRILQKHLTRGHACAILFLSNETVDAEITAARAVQRAHVGESWASKQPSNGPRRAQSKALAEYSATCDKRDLSGYFCTRKGRIFANQGGTAELFRPWWRQEISARGRFFLSHGEKEEVCLFYPRDGEPLPILKPENDQKEYK